MKKTGLLLALAVFMFTTVAFTAKANNATKTVIDCEHCKKDHKCDDKCKKGNKSKCCTAKKAGTASAKACCKKDGAKANCTHNKDKAKSSCKGHDNTKAASDL